MAIDDRYASPTLKGLQVSGFGERLLHFALSGYNREVSISICGYTHAWKIVIRSVLTPILKKFDVTRSWNSETRY